MSCLVVNMKCVTMNEAVCPPECLFSGCIFPRAHQQQRRSVGGTVLFWGVRFYAGRVSEWLPWAPSRTRHRLSCSGQLCTSSTAQLFSPWPVLQNIVCTSVIFPPPWASQRPPLLLPSPPWFLFFLFIFSFSVPPSHRGVTGFFLSHKDIVRQTHPHTFSHSLPYTNTRRALNTNHV